MKIFYLIYYSILSCNFRLILFSRKKAFEEAKYNDVYFIALLFKSFL